MSSLLLVVGDASPETIRQSLASDPWRVHVVAPTVVGALDWLSNAEEDARLRALKELVDAGIKVGVGMAPILPGLSDKPEMLADVVRAARAAGATGVWAKLLYLKPGTREHFLGALERDWPELLPEYERLYGKRAYLPAEKTKPLTEQVRELARAHGVRDRRRVRVEPPDDPEQLSLAV